MVQCRIEGKGEKMKEFMKTKAGVFLVVGAVLATWMLLAVQPGVAHDRGTSLPSPSCSGIPEDAFFTGTETAPITAADTTPDLMTKRGTGVSRRGDIRYHYAKITIPELAAGELRVFHTTAGAISDTVLCRSGRSVESSRKSYSAHDSAFTAAAAATTAAAAATRAATYHTDPDGDDQTSDAIDLTDVNNLSAARSALSRARSALSAARTALNRARTALNRFSTAAAITAAGAALGAETAALTAYNNSTLPSTSLPDNDELMEVRETLTNTAVPGLTAAATALADDAAAALTAAANSEHTGFEIRTEVSPGDEEYVVVVALENTQTPPRATTTVQTLNVAFHGAIATTATTNIDGSLSAGDKPPYGITITAPGLLTVETTGSTDTVGMLDGPDTTADDDLDPDEIAQAESGGSGGNFKIVAPVKIGAHTVYVEGQDPETTGDYTLDMDFKVAMKHSPAPIGTGGNTDVTMVDGPDWGAVSLLDDGTDPTDRPELDGRTDEDYFVFSIADDQHGFLTVEAANDLDTAADGDADTTGTLFGPLGEIVIDSNSGAGNHFKMRVPVKTGDYLVQVTGSAGGYKLEFDLDKALDLMIPPDRGSNPNGLDCTDGNGDYEICATPDTNVEQERDRYSILVEESGELYVHTEGGTNTFGILYGPDGSKIAENDDSGSGQNFRIAVNVDAGMHLIEVRGKDRSVQGAYELVTNFIAGPGPEPPTTRPEPPTTRPEPDPEPTDDHGNTQQRATSVTGDSSTSGRLSASDRENPAGDVDYFEIEVTQAGTLTVRTTGSTDTEGTLYRGSTQVAMNDDSGDGNNFEIVEEVTPGTYHVAVRGYRGRTGAYTLQVSFEAAAPADPTGALENPLNGQTVSRGGIGLISGWVCEATEVTIKLVQGSTEHLLTAGYGTSRGDTSSECNNDDGNNGFGLTWNWSLLAEGAWTVTALADEVEFGSATVDVVHLIPGQERALGLSPAPVRVPNFPETGKTTILEWEENSQNFVITGVE